MSAQGFMLKKKAGYGVQAILALMLMIVCLYQPSDLFGSRIDDWEGGRPDGCTTITVGRNASDGGWVSTSHTCDSHRTRSWFNIMPPKDQGGFPGHAGIQTRSRW